MEYSLVKINRLSETPVLNNGDYILTEVRDVRGEYISKRARIDVAFASDNIRLAHAGLIQIDITDPMFDIDELQDLKALLQDELLNQDDANLVFATAIKGLIEKVNKQPSVILQPATVDPNNPESTGPPRLPDDGNGKARYYTEGSIWVDTDTFRTYIYFYDRDPMANNDPDNDNEDISRHWVSITDR